MINYSFGDVVLVPFPLTDQTSSKKRPSVIVSSDIYNQERLDRIIMAITSQSFNYQQIGDLTITEWQIAGLIKPSWIKPIVATVESGLIIKKLGRLQSADIVSLQQLLTTIIGS